MDLASLTPVILAVGAAAWYGVSKYVDSSLKHDGKLEWGKFDTTKFLATLCVSLGIGLYSWTQGIEICETSFIAIFTTQVGTVAIIERGLKLGKHWIGSKTQQPPVP